MSQADTREVVTDESDGLDLEGTDRAIVNAFQGGFPVVRHPFEPAAEALYRRGVDVDADELVERVRRLVDEGYLTQFGPRFDAEEIGGTATLVATHVPEDATEAVTELLDDRPEVAHTDQCEHPHLNVWFVVSVVDESRVEEVLAEIEAATGRETYLFPTHREFCDETTVHVDGPVDGDDVDLTNLGPCPSPSGRDSLTPDERDLVVTLQDGLPITETPYADVTESLDVDTDATESHRTDAHSARVDSEWVVETIRRFNDEGKIRRVGVVPDRHALGYTESGTTVWDVPDDVVDEVGAALAELDFVTHCEERPRHEDVWPYNVFATVLARTDAERDRRVQQLRDVMAEHWDVADDDWDTLSTRVPKPTDHRLATRADANTEPETEDETETETETESDATSDAEDGTESEDEQ
ncbi:Lrp/AsnC family transcriptional regulator [Halospeciosus flavus]|uniref:siroheme decarboxylase n=1 Tax=Halospeciosus flavus TaxID=3032283 RepID=A0ABD5Z8J8_9EURY